MSTTGVAPETTTVSSSVPTASSTFSGTLTFAATSTPSRRTVSNPGRVNVTEYVPGRRLIIVYLPSASVTADRTFSMRTGLDTSTLTPGRTAFVLSVTSPLIVLCAAATPGYRTMTNSRFTVESRQLTHTLHLL